MAKGKNSLEIKKFNKDGLIELRDFYHANYKKKKADISIPSHLCADPLLTMSLDTPKYIDLDKAKNFDNRYELAKYFYNLLHQSISDEELNSQGMWEWITLQYFDSVFTTSKHGWTLRRYDNYIYMPSKKERDTYKMPVSPQWSETTGTGDRHCVRGPYIAYESFPNEAKVILNADYGSAFRGDAAEQLLARRWIKDYGIVNKVFKKVFLIPGTDSSLKKGWSSEKGPGSLRRYIAVVDSIMYEHNLNKMKDSDVIRELGKEFS